MHKNRENFYTCLNPVSCFHTTKVWPRKLFNRKDALLRALGGQASASFFGTRHLKPQSSKVTFGITFQPRHGLHSVVLVHIGKDINRSMANTFFPDKKDLYSANSLWRHGLNGAKPMTCLARP